MMQKTDICKQDPERYARVKAEQERLMALCSGKIKVARLCPYCGHKIDEPFQGVHGYTYAKCGKCGECVIFPPLSFLENTRG